MVRMLISLDPEEKSWLARRAAERGIPMSALVREAIRCLRSATDPSRTSYDALLERTRGIWRHGDGLIWQERLRDAW